MFDFIKGLFKADTSPKYSMYNPPNLASEAIFMALADLEWAERQPLYKIDMQRWHDAIDETLEEPCYVCLAGSVMARTLEAPINRDLSPYKFENNSYTWSRILRAINALRMGHVSTAITEWPGGFPTMTVASANGFGFARLHDDGYTSDPKLFKTRMRVLARTLKELGC